MKRHGVFTFILVFIFLMTSSVFANGETVNGNDFSIVSTIFKLIFYLICFGIVIFLAHYSSKLIAQKTSNLTKANNMKILDTLIIDKNNKISIVKIFDTYQVIGVNNNQMIIIDKFNSQDVILHDMSKTKSIKDFQGYLEKFNSLRKNKQNSINTSSSDNKSDD